MPAISVPISVPSNSSPHASVSAAEPWSVESLISAIYQGSISVFEKDHQLILIIVILVACVAGGLAFIFGALVVCRYCANQKYADDVLKPQQSSAFTKSNLVSSAITTATNPLHQQCISYQNANDSPNSFSVLLDLANDTKKIAQVFPLMNQIHNSPLTYVVTQDTNPKLSTGNNSVPNSTESSTVSNQPEISSMSVQVRRSQGLRAEQGERSPGYSNRNRGFSMENPIVASKSGSKEKVNQKMSLNEYQVQTSKATSFLTVQSSVPFRTHSAEHLTPQLQTEEELRRASFDTAGSYRRPGTGRKLPSTEPFEKALKEQQTLSPPTRFDVPHIVTPEEAPPIPARPAKQRRASFLPRSNAIEASSVIVPRKQNSSPLPHQNQRIYERGHIYSRSWNAECYDGSGNYEANENYIEESLPSAVPAITQPRRYYSSSLHPSFDRPSIMLIPPGSSGYPTSPQPPDYFPTSPRSPGYNPRQYHHMRQETQMILQPKNEIFRQCQDLWQTRRTLEAVKFYARDSTDLSDEGPSAVSTSFESNTEPVQQQYDANNSQNRGKHLELPRRMSNADLKRQKYKDLLIHRRLQQTCPEHSSFDSIASDSTSEKSKLGSSLDSSETVDRRKDKVKATWVKSMMQLHNKRSNNLQRAIANRTLSAKYVPTRSLSKPYQHQCTSYDLQRDYSVDTKSDSLFRDFSRLDPRYDTPSVALTPTLNPVQYPPGFKPNPRRRSSHMMQAISQYRSADNPEYYQKYP